MKSNTSKRRREARSVSVDSISDEECYQVKEKSYKLSDSRNSHNKRHRRRNSGSSSGEEINYRVTEKTKKYKYSEYVVKEEPLSENERDRKYKNKHSRGERRNERHDRDESRLKFVPTESRSRSRVPVKEEIQSEKEPEWGKKEIKTEKQDAQKNNAKPDFGLSGKLTEDANTFKGVVIKYSEPPEARKPKRRWRLYPFKGETSLPVLHIHRQSAYLMGRDRKVADIPIDHPSCSKQHAALQYRLVPFSRGDGSKGRQIKLYMIDLESANGTFLNNNKIQPKKYYELKERDVVKFGFSSREYVLLHEHSKDSENDDDVNDDL